MAGPWEAYQSADAGPWSEFKSKPKAAPADKYDPTEGMSFADKAFAGAGKAMVDMYRGGAQLLGADNQAEIDESKRLDAPLMNTGAGVVGNLVGNVAATALPGMGVAKAVSAVPKLAQIIAALQAARPVASAVGLGAATGGAMGALEPVATGGSRAANVATSAGIGAAGGALPGVLARVVKPNTSDDVTRLLDEGVRLTPGQTMGGMAKAAEDKLTSIPVLGDMIQNARRRGMEDFNRAGFNRALAPIGEKVGKDFNIGREGIEAVEGKIGAAYDSVLTKIKRVDLDASFNGEISKIAAMTDELGEGAASQFKSIVQNRVMDKITPAGTMSAETMKAVESELGRQARTFMSSADANQRGLGAALREVQSSLRRNVERTAGPELAADLKAANTAWANFVRIQDAAGRIGAKDGVFSGAQLTSAVRKGDGSVRKGAFARGDALMQDLAESGKNVLPSAYPDSGTPGRLMQAAGIGTIAGGAAISPQLVAGAAAAMLPYTNIGGQALTALLTKRPEVAKQIADLLNAGAPAGAIASGLMAPLLAGPQ